MKKVASLDPERSLDFVDELSLSGWGLSSALQGYVQGAGKTGDWAGVIRDLQEFESRRGLSDEKTPLRPETQNVIASEWIQENFDDGMQWFTREIPRDFSNPEDLKNVTATLWSLPAEERYRVVDWVERQQEEPGWDDQLILSYAPALLRSQLDGNAERLAGLISSEDQRVQFVTTFVGSTQPSDRVRLRYSPESLNRLIEAARLPEEQAENFQNVIASGSWSPPKVK